MSAPRTDAEAMPGGVPSHLLASHSDRASALRFYWGIRLGYAESDVGNARRFALDWAGETIYVEGAGWHHWDSRRWRRDDDNSARRRMIATAARIGPEADLLRPSSDAAADGDGEAVERSDKASAARFRFRLKSENAPRIAGALHAAEVETQLAVRADALDADPWALNVANGTLDLRTGELRPHDPADRHTRLVDVAYDPAAPAPRWERFLLEIYEGDQELVDFDQRAIGYTLTGDCSEQVLFLCHGTGSNGKSVRANVLRALLGDYAATVDVDTLAGRESLAGGARSDLVRLRGARLALTSEVNEGARLDERLVKQLTGQDVITARELYRGEIEFEPAFKIWMAANHRPRVAATDEAMWRRLRLIPFNRRFDGAQRDPHLAAALHAELPGILAWAVRGCLEWQRAGLGQPLAVVQATAEMRDDMDELDEFIEAHCLFAHEHRATTAALRGAYTAWAQRAHQKPLPDCALHEALRARGCTSHKWKQDGKSVRGWLGVGLTTGHDHHEGDTGDTPGRHPAKFPGENESTTSRERCPRVSPVSPLAGVRA